MSILIVASIAVHAQTQFWSDTFEDAGAPSSGTRTPSVNNSSGGPPATRYFWRCATSNISLVNVYTNIQGSKFWAGEAQQLSPVVQSSAQSVTWTGINISGKSGMSFAGMFASGPANFDIPPSSPVTDYVIVEYRIDGGAWTNGLRFFPYNPTIATYLSLETTGDSVGEGVTLLNSANFTQFTFNISGTGTTMDLRLKAHVNGTSEEWAADNFRLFYASLIPVKLLSFDLESKLDANKLTWETATEQNTSHFEVERSSDGINYSRIGIVPAKGNSFTKEQYSYTDKSATGKCFYRLKTVDVDNHSEYSKVLFARSEAENILKLYPNPISSGNFTIQSNLLESGKSIVKMYDQFGKKIPIKIEGTGSIRYCSTYALAKGIYYIEVEKDGNTVTKILLKN